MLIASFVYEIERSLLPTDAQVLQRITSTGPMIAESEVAPGAQTIGSVVETGRLNSRSF